MIQMGGKNLISTQLETMQLCKKTLYLSSCNLDLEIACLSYKVMSLDFLMTSSVKKVSLTNHRENNRSFNILPTF